MPEIAAAARRMMIIGSVSSFRKRTKRGTFLASFSLLGPDSERRRPASEAESPDSLVFSSFRTSSDCCK